MYDSQQQLDFLLCFLHTVLPELSERLHHFKDNAIRVSEIKSSAFPKFICSEIEILRLRQALHMIFDIMKIWRT